MKIALMMMTLTTNSVFLFTLLKQGQQKWSGCSGFDQTGFSPGKIESPFSKYVLNKSSSMIFELVRLIILSYNGYKRHVKRCKIFGCPRNKCTRYSVVQKAM